MCRRLADHIDSVFGPGKKEGIPGHAVHALYMYEAMADLAIATNDEELLACCETL